ncbi:hypothetical protein TIFTF001_054375, partial [Ficus carica]
MRTSGVWGQHDGSSVWGASTAAAVILLLGVLGVSVKKLLLLNF